MKKTLSLFLAVAMLLSVHSAVLAENTEAPRSYFPYPAELENLPENPSLPDLFEFFDASADPDGSGRVETPEEWDARAAEIRDMAQYYLYGSRMDPLKSDTTVTAVRENYAYNWSDGVMNGAPGPWGYSALPNLPEGALPHWDLCAKYNIVDFELGNKITGAGFPVYKGKGARLQRALIDFFLDQATAAGYVEIMPPLMVNEASGLGTGQLPDKEGQMYAIPLDGFYMIPTAEVPITNLYRNVIVSPDQFPIRHVGYSECFRREAGSYGKDVRGLNRLHEFSKVEIVVIEHPDRSYDTLEDMKRHVGGLLDKLGLPYHILKLCGGDISFTSAMTFDFEVWSAAQQKWLEVSSVSNFETFQANRMKLRFKDTDGKTKLAHTLIGSALALPRIVAALLENNQTPDGIVMPECLRPYLGFDKMN